MVNQEQAATATGLGAIRETGQALLQGQPLAFVLHLPHHPAGGDDAAHPQAFGWITAVAVAYGVD
jgi:hypothetical protein